LEYFGKIKEVDCRSHNTEKSFMSIRLCLTGNEPRQRYLFEELTHIVDVKAIVPFDDIDPLTKMLAAGLSFSWPRLEWWENYYMHPLMQRRRRNVLRKGIAPTLKDIDALLMWGSWFQPFLGKNSEIPFFHYIDQSHSLTNLPGERHGHFARRKKAHALQAKCYAAASGIFCMSDWARNQTLESHTVRPEKVTAVGWGPCAVDLSNEELGCAERDPIVLHVSNDFYRKGVDFLIDTAERVFRTIPTARFLVVGRDSSGFAVPATSRVEFLGPVYDKVALASLFRAASVFFLPHRFDRSPHVLVEAMSASLPLVASSQGGAVELINGKDTGYLCEPGAVDQYAEAIITLLRDTNLKRRMGSNGRNLMRQRYNWQTVAQRIANLIENALGAKERSPSN
jgi:glycosyltransferase involved in cell wall biosynthesis